MNVTPTVSGIGGVRCAARQVPARVALVLVLFRALGLWRIRCFCGGLRDNSDKFKVAASVSSWTELVKVHFRSCLVTFALHNGAEIGTDSHRDGITVGLSGLLVLGCPLLAGAAMNFGPRQAQGSSRMLEYADAGSSK